MFSQASKIKGYTTPWLKRKGSESNRDDSLT